MDSGQITIVRPLKDAAGTLPLIGMTVRISSISLLLNHTDYKLLTNTISLILRESHPNLKYAAVPPLSEIVDNLRGEGQSKVTFRLSLHITSMRARLEEKVNIPAYRLHYLLSGRAGRCCEVRALQHPEGSEAGFGK